MPKEDRSRTYIIIAVILVLSIWGEISYLKTTIYDLQERVESLEQKSGDLITDAAGKVSFQMQEKRFCYIVEGKWDKEPYLTLDFAQFLTGEAAQEAAKKRGDEAPNGFYIVNDSQEKEAYPVDTENIKVYLITNTDGSQNTSDGMVSPYMIGFDKWYEWFSGKSSATDYIRKAPYWVTIENGKIVKIEEQYIP